MRTSRNKNALKQQRDQLATYRRFLPSLDLKRQQLLAAWKSARVQRAAAEADLRAEEDAISGVLSLLGSSTLPSCDLASLIRVETVRVTQENIVGTRVPRLEAIHFSRADYSTLALPFWVDLLLDALQRVAEKRWRLLTARQREAKIAEASRKITQRVNLFEKVLIPDARRNIKSIRVALSDEERAAVVRSKLAKRKHQR